MSKREDKALIPVVQKEFKKANEVIATRVARGGAFTLLSRKVFNALLYHTQRLGSPGEGAPEGPEVFKTLYWLPLHELSKDTAFNSEDVAVLKETLLKLQDIKIITDDSSGFSSDVLVASIKIIPGERRKPTMVGWGLHPATEAILRSPEVYTRLSLYYLTSLSSTAGAALYEICKRYSTNPSALTRREPWEWWYEVLTGNPVGGEKPEYKYFKRDTLNVALKAVATTDVEVELIEHKVGRRIAELQFKVGRKAQSALELPPPPVIDSTLIKRIVALGMHSREAEDIFASTEDEFLRKTLDLVERRIQDTKQPAIASPGAYFRTALRDRYADATLVKPPRKLISSNAPKPADQDSILEKEQAKLIREDALDQFDAMPLDEQDRLFADFLREHPALVSHARKSKRAKIVRQALATWILVAHSKEIVISDQATIPHRN